MPLKNKRTPDFVLKEFGDTLNAFPKWVVTWIGKARLQTDRNDKSKEINSSYMVSIWFYPERFYYKVIDHQIKFDSSLYKPVKVPYELLNLFVIGSVWSRKGKILKPIIKNEWFQNKRDILRFSESRLPQKIVELIPDIKDALNSPFDAVKVVNTPCIRSEQNGYTYILPSSEVARYFFFSSSRMIRYFFSVQKPKEFAKIEKEPDGTIPRQIDIFFAQRLTKSDQFVLTKYLLLRDYKSAGNYIIASLKVYENNNAKGKSDEISAYYKCNLPVNKKLSLYIAYHPIYINKKEYRVVTQILDDVDDYGFDKINPILPLVHVQSEGNKTGIVKTTKYTLDRCDLELDVDNLNESDPNSNEIDVPQGIPGEKYFKKPELSINSIRYIETEVHRKGVYVYTKAAETAIVSTHAHGNDDSDRPAVIPTVKEDGNDNIAPEFYELFLEAMEILELEKGCSILYAKFDTISKEVFFQERKTIIQGKYNIHFCARIIHPNHAGVHYAIESGKEGTGDHHMTGLISIRSQKNDMHIQPDESLHVQKILTIVEQENALWGNIRRKELLDDVLFEQKHLDHQINKSALHFAEKIMGYFEANFDNANNNLRKGKLK